MIQELLKAFERHLTRELGPDERVIETVENAGAIWFTTKQEPDT